MVGARGAPALNCMRGQVSENSHPSPEGSVLAWETQPWPSVEHWVSHLPALDLRLTVHKERARVLSI